MQAVELDLSASTAGMNELVVSNIDSNVSYTVTVSARREENEVARLKLVILNCLANVRLFATGSW